ncbi:hypothetical protein FM106_13900 [Brachybacterium faecium]|nr:hypothetical protein FM106_13900 [Brachybacterium faecium]
MLSHIVLTSHLHARPTLDHRRKLQLSKRTPPMFITIYAIKLVCSILRLFSNQKM